ncbi:DMT family transporter [Pseudorhodoferax sp. Leaf274]|uniref:DMT family transporter n=1 Tax=Pseudorhodoferax sp. Leaf274 TaxID=1736318 RepID=UPI0009EA9696|nr:DMT family transporter [Pseudorhodoferax sp. Leaf274]
MPSRLAASACLAASMALVGSYVALSKPLAAAFPVLLLAWLRFGIAAVAMLPWLRKPAHEPSMPRSVRRLVFLESFLGNFLFSICMIYGVSMTSAVSAGVVMAAIPAAVAIASWLLLRERVTSRAWAAVACAVVGIGLLGIARPGHGAPGSSAQGNALWGHLLLFAAVLCEAAYAVIGKKLTGSLGPKRISALINLWGLVLATPFGLHLAAQFDFGAIDAGLWVLLVFYALAASIWTVWLWMTGLRAIPAAQAGVFSVLLPVSAALTGVLALGESMGALEVLALLIALAGVALATLPSRTVNDL